ncbi:EstA family serine hydrolase [Moraxella caviae]|uniref:EstA family serine hydrolase n=2 Tax=Moraxella caviae TaxID=34060 RepID=A0A1S9ZYQ7_9GAMM|nr:EstA family serine hydrolase [Moraxella caviae]STZ14941.1 putative periplasmic esterase [Moraxella caviae]VEW12685.1 putative periplasmic esterase [Moraxella caviae]
MTAWQTLTDALTPLQFQDSPAGGALMVWHDGDVVVDTAVGCALPETAWHTRTLSVNFSIGKGVMATLIAVLVSRGLLKYDAPIADVWPQFAANGKQNITLRDVLTHSAGLFNITTLTKETADLIDWQIMLDKVANMAADTPKGQDDERYASAYSALVSGWILGGVVERATGLPLQEALEQYLAVPLGVAGELYYGVPADKLAQIAKPVRYFSQDASAVRRKPVLKPDTPEILAVLNDTPAAQIWQSALAGAPIGTASVNKLYFDTSAMNLVNYKNALMPNGRDGVEYHSDEVLQAKIPAANGVSSARALMTLYAMHAAGGVWQGQTLITPEVLADMRKVQIDGMDAVMPANMCWRSGFHRLFTVQNAPTAYGHMGYNGSVAFCDPERKLAFAFIHNFDTTMLNDVRQFALSELALKIADEL